MLEKIISGGETGAEQAGLRIARAYSVSTGGWMRKGFLTEEGFRPGFATEFGASELPTEHTADQIELNIVESDATIWFGETATSAAHAIVSACCTLRKACMPISSEALFEPSQVATWIMEQEIKTLNVTGSRESEEPGIGDRVERFLGQVLEQFRNTSSRA